MDESKRGGRHRRTTWAAFMLIAAIGGGAEAGTYSGLVVFGDSLSDGGNVAAAVTAAGGAYPYDNYPAGKSTNGDVWVDYLADMLGVARPTASLLGGTNYAFAYAQSGGGFSTPAELGGAPIPNLMTQVGMFQGTLGGSPMDSSQLVAIWAGANDFLHGGVDTPAEVLASVANVIAAVQAVAALGGTDFLVGGIPYLGSLPATASLPQAQRDGLNMLNYLFNATLEGELAQLGAANPGLRIVFNDVNSAFGQILADPSAYGLTNLTDPAVVAIAAGGDPNPDHYLFWDTVHPTTKVHEYIAAAAFAAVVPEPSSIVLASIAGLAVAAAARRRAA